MTREITATLRNHFGLTTFRPGQAEAIGHLLAGRHTLVVMPTGAGKSLIYQLASFHRPGITLVLSPLIALMKDQVDHLTNRSIPATCINSTVPRQEQTRRLRALAAGAFRLAYVAPERLRSVPFRRALQRVTVGLLAVDEAHCISQWGHDFRPDYLHIAAARGLMGDGDPLTVALTATAPPEVQDDIVDALGLASAERVITGFNRPNLTFEVCYTADLPAKLRALRDLLAGLGPGGAIVYVGTRRDAEEVAEFVGEVVGLEARHYHAGLDGEMRAEVQEAFLSGDLPVVVATNAFGMGIDRADVRLVVHYTMPGRLETYYQEAGRAGRDGEPARAVLLYAPQDRALQEWFIENSAPTAAEMNALYRALQATLRAPGQDVVATTTEELLLDTGLPEVKMRVGLAQLERAGVVRHLGDEGVRMLLRPGRWDHRAIERTIADAETRRRRRRDQLGAMVTYAESNGCRRRILLAHFGDRGAAESARCCDNCLAQSSPVTMRPGGDPAQLSQSERAALIILDALRRLKWEIGQEKLSQILKGSRAKAMRQLGYDQHPYYGGLEVFTLAEIRGMIQQLIEQGYVKMIGGDRPVLRLTPQGKGALQARASIPLRLLRKASPRNVARKRAEREAGGTVALTEQLFAQGHSPAEIAAQRGLTVSTIYNHLAHLIGEGVLPLAAVVPDPIVAQVHRAIAGVGDVSKLAPIKVCLPATISYGQIRCVVTAWEQEREQAPASPDRNRDGPAEATGPTGSGEKKGEGTPRPVPGAGATFEESARLGEEEPDDVADDAVAAFLARPHPRPLDGPWEAGWALGFHSRFSGGNWQRSPVGELAYRLKYQGDVSTLAPLVEQALALCADHGELASVDALVPVPPSVVRPFDPVRAWADALGRRLGRPVWPALVRTRPTAPQKEMTTRAQKRTNVAGAFAVQGEVQGKDLLVLDDLYDSGATLEEVTRVLRQAGAARVFVLTLTKTIHTDA